MYHEIISYAFLNVMCSRSVLLVLGENYFIKKEEKKSCSYKIIFTLFL